jgi:asparagine synthase (glutamine-hydrolysing)
MKQKYTLENIPKDEATINRELFETLCEAVELRTRQMDEACKVGFMLSGGFDSSLVLSLALAGGIKRPVQAYTFGFEKDADDVKSARVMVDWVKAKYGPDAIDWHLVHRPVSDGLNALSQVIKSIETYDTTTVRASTPMYLLSQAMHRDGIRVILSGEGADELFGGYLYFKCAPNHKEYISEIGFLLDHLFEADCLRADRATAAWSTEVRFPFLDEVLADRVIKANIIQNDLQNTKMTLRKLVPEGFLPPSIHWGKKEAFSDAVGHSWKDSILAFAESELKKYPSDLPAQHAAPNDLPAQLNDKTKPRTKEEEFYQKVFVSTFGDRRTILSRYWMPNWIEAQDPSARVLKVYQDNPIAKS